MGACDFAVRHGMHPAYWSSWADVLPVIASRDPAFASALVDTLEGGFARTRSPTVASPRSCFFDGVWICSQGRHAGGVDRNLDPSPERQAVSLDAAVIVSAGCDIEVPHQDVGCNSSTSFTADTSGRTLARITPDRGQAAK